MLQKSNQVKIQVMCPRESVNAVRQAIARTGAGKIGSYDSCAFVTYGTGYFRPLPGARPAIGTIGELETVEEAKIEFTCQEENTEDILMAIREVHPYEEIAYDIIPLLAIE